MDAGFFDQDIFQALEQLGVGYLCGGKQYPDLTALAADWEEGQCHSYTNEHQQWDYLEIGDRRGNWQRFRRAIYLRTQEDPQQQCLPFACSVSIFYTNLGLGDDIDRYLINAGLKDLLTTPALITHYHQRGSDELVIRATKEFASETLPCTRFNMNAAFYYMMLLSFFSAGSRTLMAFWKPSSMT